MWVHQKKGFTLTVRRMIIADTKNFIFLPRSPHAARPPPPNFVVLSNTHPLQVYGEEARHGHILTVMDSRRRRSMFDTKKDYSVKE